VLHLFRLSSMLAALGRELGVSEAHSALLNNGLRDRVVLRC
jgi:glutamate synthase domain-containing protein 2